MNISTFEAVIVYDWLLGVAVVVAVIPTLALAFLFESVFSSPGAFFALYVFSWLATFALLANWYAGKRSEG